MACTSSISFFITFTRPSTAALYTRQRKECKKRNGEGNRRQRQSRELSQCSEKSNWE
jgi:hypothetical protein